MKIELTAEEVEAISQALYMAVFHNPMRFQAVQEAFVAKVQACRNPRCIDAACREHHPNP